MQEMFAYHFIQQRGCGCDDPEHDPSVTWCVPCEVELDEGDCEVYINEICDTLKE